MPAARTNGERARTQVAGKGDVGGMAGVCDEAAHNEPLNEPRTTKKAGKTRAFRRHQPASVLWS